jgi:hypothetical protein
MTREERRAMWKEYRASSFEVGVWEHMQDGFTREAAV